MNNIPQLPLVEWVDAAVSYLRSNARWVFDPISDFLDAFVNTISDVLMFFPPLVFIVLMVLLTVFLTKKVWGLPVFVLLGLGFIWNLDFWDGTMLTLSLILSSSLIAIVIGIPVGIWMAKNKTVESFVKPILDFMQTMPAFVYLIPAVSFFGIGMVPGIIASVIFAMPPVVRLTNLGIREVSNELIEASDAFGATGWQKLFKVQLPLAKNTIMQGINQTIMLALSMVVIASMIGAEGLGTEVYRAIGRNQAGQGFASGIAIVILAIILDRLIQVMNKQKYSV
ncbi:ABC transporter permease [Fusibacter tunisiensis]|jgi:glycine betaine/proline transport system permease protein|uniref:Glycine betaine/proline transport system permease protein n=1 Tax=Fusibacter tunisiensis TaxID=1008308 RepID=A0ABS2MSN8_9FIRM|nr:proline/glycine betaine ABC transporter permease [Fusibacter tunisiensis]MBM7562409.1 glycine betaine/proline transport system permease protein [Fusibacter tunisiensis]